MADRQETGCLYYPRFEGANPARSANKTVPSSAPDQYPPAACESLAPVVRGSPPRSTLHAPQISGMSDTSEPSDTAPPLSHLPENLKRLLYLLLAHVTMRDEPNAGGAGGGAEDALVGEGAG